MSSSHSASKLRSWFSRLISPTSNQSNQGGVADNEVNNEYKFKSSSSITRLDRAAAGDGAVMSRQQTATIEQNGRFKSSSATSLVKHEEKLKQKQTAQVVVKQDGQKVN